MTIATEITRIKTNIQNAYTKAEEKGATIPSVKNSANLASCIESITTGGSSSGDNSNTGGTTGGIEKRGDWLVPEIYTQVDQAVDLEDDLYNEINAYHSARSSDPLAVFGFMLHRGYYSSLRINLQNYIYAVKCSDGSVHYSSTVKSGGVTSVSLEVDNSSNDKYFIAYCSKVPQLATSGYIDVTNSMFSSMPLSRLAQYYAFKGQCPTYSAGSMGGFPEASLVSFNVIGEIDDAYKAPSITAFEYNANNNVHYEYIPPVNIWCKTNLMTNLAYNTFARKTYKCLPDGLSLSNYSNTSSPLTIGYSGSSSDDKIYNAHFSRMYVKLPSVSVKFNQGITLTKDNWQYIADNAPAVSGQTLTMGTENISVCGGTNGEIIQTLKQKGWTVT